MSKATQFFRFDYKQSVATIMLCIVSAFGLITNPADAQSMTKVGPSESARTANTFQAQQRKAMEPLAFLVGEWEGEGWIQLSPTRKDNVRQYQRVESVLDGVLMTIEGRGLTLVNGSKNSAKTSAQTVPTSELAHHAFAFVSPAERLGEFKWRSHTSDGRALDVRAKVVGKDALRWGFQMSNGSQIRYTIRLDAEGHWHEVGELSPDGRTWREVFEMKLKRLKRSM